MITYFRADKPREEAAKLLSLWLREYEGRSVLLLLSGGSALSFLDLVRIPPHAKLTVSTLDERFSSDPEINNFLQLAQTRFFEHAVEEGVIMLPSIPLDHETLAHFTERLQEQITTWQRKHKNGVILATQGIGRDGHTAGIMPTPEEPDRFTELFEKNPILVGYEMRAGMLTFQERVTVTFPFLMGSVERSLVFVTGSEKAPMLRYLKEVHPRAKYPMMVLNDMRHVALVTDEGGAF